MSMGPSPATRLARLFAVSLKDRKANQRGGSEWEPIKILLEGDGNSNKTNIAYKARL
jgi:hypothetical protein